MSKSFLADEDLGMNDSPWFYIYRSYSLRLSLAVEVMLASKMIVLY
jgi:hypothetical protein